MKQRGFTLIELLMAITMLAVIVGIMGGALSLAYQTTEKGEKKIDKLEKKKIIFSLIESQVQSAFVSVYTDQGEKKNRFSGDKDKVTFASNYSLWRGAGGNCLVTYRIESDDRSKCVVRIEEQVLGTDVKKETSVTTDYDAIHFEYFLKNALEEGKWVDQWPAEEQNIPQKFRLHFEDGGHKRILSARIFTQVSSATVSTGLKPVVTK